MFKTTGDISQTHVNILVHGPSGIGKTTLAGSVESPLVLSAESGLLPLQRFDIPYFEIKTQDQIKEIYTYLKNDEGASQFQTIVIDSLSEVAEVVLADLKRDPKNKDMRQAYMAMQERIYWLIRAFRDLPFDVYFTAKSEKNQDESGRLLYSPGLPGNKLSQGLPYFLDEVLALRIVENEEGKKVRMLQTQHDGIYDCKDRSGKLDMLEAPHLGNIIAKMKGAAQ